FTAPFAAFVKSEAEQTVHQKYWDEKKSDGG
ncbi:hypothetical protein EVA_09485, partial [gut metagenome]